MNTYTTHTSKTCPNNGQTDIYKVVIQAARTIMVEDIHAALAEAEDSTYQEDLTKFLTIKLNADVTITGTHQGVLIESTCSKAMRLCRD